MNPADCEVCPFRDGPETCYAARTGNGRYCVLIAQGRTDYLEMIKELTLGRTEDPKIALARTIELCRHRKIPQCACSGHDCQAKNIRVTLKDCVSCVEAGGPP